MISTKEFCCFVWSQLSCELKVIEKCNKKKSTLRYSDHLKNTTIKMFGDFCKPIQYDDILCSNQQYAGYFLLISILSMGTVVIMLPNVSFFAFCIGQFVHNTCSESYMVRLIETKLFN